jgi:S1-C subfamily serine protease
VPDWLDLILAAVMTTFAAFGYRQGLVAGVLSLTGFACGASAGALVAPGLSRALVPAGPSREFVAILMGFAAAVTGMLLISGLGNFLRRLSRRPAGRIDSVGGAALNVVFLLVIALMVASFAASGPPGPLSRQVDRSLILRAMEQIAPKDTGYLFNSMRVSMLMRLDDASGLDPADLPPPSPAVLRSPAAAVLARHGVVRVEAASCQPSSAQSVGSGFVIGPDHVLTDAHVVAAPTRPPVVTLTGGRTYPARVVLYDRRRDIAVLYVPGLRAAVLHFTWSAPIDGSAIVAGFPRGGRLTLTPATIGLSEEAAVSGTGVDRQVYPVRGQVQPGNSGGPLMAPGGGVYGVIFARSLSAPQSGWALTAAEVARDAANGATRTAGIRISAQTGC